MRARVIDSVGNQGTSNVATMLGPQADKVTLSAANSVASVQVTAGQGNGYSHTVYLEAVSSNGSLQQI